MKRRFTISEFAKLRQININSLRYYEKLGLLKPAYVDPQTGYRYYDAEQLPVLDTILLCIDLKLPLKDLVNYIDEHGVLYSQQLFEDAKRLTEQRVYEIQMGLRKIEYALQDLTEYENKQGLYTREIGTRRFITAEYRGDLKDQAHIETEFAKLYFSALNSKRFPIIPAGLILQFDQAQHVRCRLFCEIVDEITDSATKDENILIVPQAEYLCLQQDLFPETDLIATVNEHFSPHGEMTIIVTNMILEKYHIQNKRSEFQVLNIPLF